MNTEKDAASCLIGRSKVFSDSFPYIHLEEMLGGVCVRGACVCTPLPPQHAHCWNSSWVHIYFCDLGCVMDPPEDNENSEAFSSSRRYDLGDLSSSPTQIVSSRLSDQVLPCSAHPVFPWKQFLWLVQTILANLMLLL